jgi:beta-phosphoglucomutase-like phosphatase (HAD superfamily)
LVKLIIFDLDGVLVEAKNIHYEALNKALGKKYAISWNEHLSVYDGLKTVQKLNMLTEKKGLPTEQHNHIWEDKQKNTLDMLSDLKVDSNLLYTISKLSDDG